MIPSSFEEAMKSPLAPLITSIMELSRRAIREGHSGVELELRLGQVRVPNTFAPGISRDAFSSVLELLKSNATWKEHAHTRQTDYYKKIKGNNIRLTLDEDTGKEKLTLKHRVESHTFKVPGSAYDIRLALSYEEAPGMTIQDFGDECQDSREKERISYVHRNKYGMEWRFDSTVVKTGAGGAEDPDEDNGDVIFEVEMELPWEELDEGRLGYMAVSTALKMTDVLRASDPFLSIDKPLIKV